MTCPTPRLWWQETVYTMPARSSMWAATTYGSSASALPVAPASVAIHGDDMYIGTSDNADGPVLKVTNFGDPGVWNSQGNISVLVDINDGEYVTVHNDKLYICNDDESSDSSFVAGLYRCDLDGSNLELLFDLTNDPAVSAFGSIPHKPNFHPLTGDIWLTSWSQPYLFQLDSDGNLIQTWTLSDPVTSDPILMFGGQWYEGELYLQDVNNSLLVKWNPETSSVSRVVDFSASEVGQYELEGSGTGDIVITAEGRVFGNSDLGGIWSCWVDGSDLQMEKAHYSGWPMDNPLNVLQHNGYLYIADWGEHWVYRWQIRGGVSGWQVGSVAMAGGSGITISCPTGRWRYPYALPEDGLAMTPDGQTLVGVPSDGGDPAKPVVTGYDLSDPLIPSPPILFQYPRNDSLYNLPDDGWYMFGYGAGSDGAWFYAWHDDWEDDTYSVYLQRLVRHRLSDGFQEVIYTAVHSEAIVGGLVYSHYDSKLYWVEEDGDGTNTHLRRMGIDGSGLETVSTQQRAGGIGFYAYQFDRLVLDSNGGVWARAIDTVTFPDEAERVVGFFRYDIDSGTTTLFSYAHLVPHDSLIPAIPRFYTGSFLGDGSKVYANFYWQRGNFSPPDPPNDINGYYFPNMGISCDRNGNFVVYNDDIYSNDHVFSAETGMADYIQGSSGDYKLSWDRQDPGCPDLLVAFQQTGGDGSFKTTRYSASYGQDAQYRYYMPYPNRTSLVTGQEHACILRTDAAGLPGNPAPPSEIGLQYTRYSGSQTYAALGINGASLDYELNIDGDVIAIYSDSPPGGRVVLASWPSLAFISTLRTLTLNESTQGGVRLGKGPDNESLMMTRRTAFHANGGGSFAIERVDFDGTVTSIANLTNGGVNSGAGWILGGFCWDPVSNRGLIHAWDSASIGHPKRGDYYIWRVDGASGAVQQVVGPLELVVGPFQTVNGDGAYFQVQTSAPSGFGNPFKIAYYSMRFIGNPIQIGTSTVPEIQYVREGLANVGRMPYGDGVHFYREQSTRPNDVPDEEYFPPETIVGADSGLLNDAGIGTLRASPLPTVNARPTTNSDHTVGGFLIASSTLLIYELDVQQFEVEVC